MKVLVDTNLLVSALLSATSPPYLVLARGMMSEFDLLVSAGSIDELQRKCRSKPYLAQRIPEVKLQEFLDVLMLSSTLLSPLSIAPEAVTRDPKDDYLIAHAIAEGVDVLVSGDRDLLVLDGTYPFRILAPADFIAALEREADE